ncbi:MAG: TIGR04255 family protein [candidate division KSB1 bacterium]|nr:TIGR04255 family protein [candidate division KSB1 bacterium]
MPKRYANPPIEEAVCEFRLPLDTPWDMTIPGLIYEKLKDEFPIKEQRWVQEIELTHGPEGLQQRIHTSERVLLFDKDRRTFVQVGPRLLAVNTLKPYPTWIGFKPKIQKAFESLSRAVGFRDLERIGLRYINRIELPGWRVRLEEHFDFYLFLGSKLPQDLTDFIVAGEFTYASGRDRCRVQLKPLPCAPGEHRVLILDIDYFLAEKAVDVSGATGWVEEAHDRVEEVFEGCIKDSLRKMFQEAK